MSKNFAKVPVSDVGLTWYIFLLQELSVTLSVNDMM